MEKCCDAPRYDLMDSPQMSFVVADFGHAVIHAVVCLFLALAFLQALRHIECGPKTES